jgi:glycosyltransferase involved in cell wall biosynthesis
MKIAMMSEHASPLAALGGVDAGGQNVHVAELAAALGRRGHEVVVYTRRDSPELPQRVPMAPNVLVDHLDAGPARPVPKDNLPPFVPQMAAELSRRLQAEPPDVVHAHFWMSGLVAVGAAGALRVPVVQTFHALGVVKRRYQGSADTSPPERIRCERALARRCARVLASSRDERDELMRMGADARRIDVVPSGVDLTLFGTEGVRRERRLRHRAVVICRLVPRKGVDDAIRAVAQVPDTELLIAGGPEADSFDDDAEVRRLRALIAELGVADRVELLGSVAHDELAPLIRSADAVLCLPWYEPFGIVPLEAMACGVPVVAAAVGGLLDTVVDGVTGLHVPPRDADAAAAALRMLLGDDERRRRLGHNAARRVARYDWAEVAARVEQSYAEAAGLELTTPAKEVAG